MGAIGTKLNYLMGNKTPEKKRVRKHAKVYDYTLGPARKRPKTSKSVREARYIMMLGQQGRSATMSDINTENQQVDPNRQIPKWQSRWEVDMRPDPTKPKPVTLRAWKSMPLPTTAQASAIVRSNPSTKPSSRRSRRSKLTRDRRGISGRLNSGRLPEVEEPDRFDLASITSNIIDEFKMIYKSDIRTQSLLDLTAQRWQTDQKKNNKTWFLGPENQKNIPEPTVSFEHMPKQSKPFASMVNLVRSGPRLDHKEPTIHKPERNIVKQETIMEEE